MQKVAGVILLVSSIENAASFYQKLGFGVTEERPDIATIVSLGDFWVELLHETKVVSEEYKAARGVTQKGAGAYLQVQVDNIDNFYERITEAGITTAGKPQDFPWQHRESIVTDPDGYKIAFFSKI